MCVCKKSEMYKCINNDNKNNDDDEDDDDHNILLYVGLKLSLNALLLYLQLYLEQCDRGHIHVMLNVILCID